MTEKNIIHFESGVLSFLCDNFHSVYLCFLKLHQCIMDKICRLLIFKSSIQSKKINMNNIC